MKDKSKKEKIVVEPEEFSKMSSSAIVKMMEEDKSLWILDGDGKGRRIVRKTNLNI